MDGRSSLVLHGSGERAPRTAERRGRHSRRRDARSTSRARDDGTRPTRGARHLGTRELHGSRFTNRRALHLARRAELRAAGSDVGPDWTRVQSGASGLMPALGAGKTIAGARRPDARIGISADFLGMAGVKKAAETTDTTLTPLTSSSAARAPGDKQTTGLCSTASGTFRPSSEPAVSGFSGPRFA